VTLAETADADPESPSRKFVTHGESAEAKPAVVDAAAPRREAATPDTPLVRAIPGKPLTHEGKIEAALAPAQSDAAPRNAATETLADTPDPLDRPAEAPVFARSATTTLPARSVPTLPGAETPAPARAEAPQDDAPVRRAKAPGDGLEAAEVLQQTYEVETSAPVDGIRPALPGADSAAVGPVDPVAIALSASETRPTEQGRPDSSGPDSPKPTAPDHGARASQQVAAALALSHDGRIEIRLDPEELGPVRVALEPADGTMTVHVSADRGETLDLLRRNSDQLARDLRDIGYRDVSFDFGSEQRPDSRQPPAYEPFVPSAAEPGNDVAPTLPASVRRAVASAGLDLRL
jgi:flagellar hook-length control protein FliK